jgi:neutral amino acid transport system permease protein
MGAMLNGLLNIFNVDFLIFAAIYALFSLGLNLQWGFTGLINFGHVAFMTVGAYTTVLLSQRGVPLGLAALVGGGLAAVLGLLIGLTTLRLREDYLSIVTVGVAEVVRLVAANEEWLTQGTFGIQKFPLPLENFRPTVFSELVMVAIVTAIAAWAYGQIFRWLRQRLTGPQSRGLRDARLGIVVLFAGLGLWLYGVCVVSLLNFVTNAPRNGVMFVAIILVAVTYWRLEVLVRSPWGRILKSIREDEEVAKALGKNVFWYKLQSLMLGGFIAGVAGALFAWHLSTVYPDTFGPLLTFYGWTVVVMGGAGSNIGTILGALIFWGYFTVTRFALPAIAPALHSVIPSIPASLDEARLGAFRLMLIGVLLIVLMMLRPQGILGNRDELTLGR